MGNIIIKQIELFFCKLNKITPEPLALTSSTSFANSIGSITPQKNDNVNLDLDQ